MIINKKKKCITVGLEYPKTKNALYGCYNDADLIENTMKYIYGFTNDEIISIRDKPENFNGNKQNILKILNDTATSDYDFVVFYYAGHGIRVNDISKDESNIDSDRNNEYSNIMQGGKARDSALVTSEMNGRTNLIIDDEIKEIWNKFSKNTLILNIYDCCHSGSMSDLNFYYILKNVRNFSDEIINENNLERLRFFTKDLQYINKKFNNVEVNCTVISISGARDSQYTYEFKQMGQTHGHFTVTICNLLRNIITMRNNQNRKYLYSLADIYKIVA